MPFKQNVVQASDVASLAFVFHASYLEHVWVNCTGMELVYFTCYSLENNNSLSLLPTDLQFPLMPIGVGESYPSRMWHSLMHVKDKVGSLLNVRTQLQSCQRSTPVFLPLDSWDFICKHFYPITRPIPFYKSQTKPHQFCDLSLLTKTTIVSHIMLQVADYESIEAARKLFGHTFGIRCENNTVIVWHDQTGLEETCDLRKT